MQKTLLTLALLGTMGTAQAAHLEIGAGYAKGKLVANGTWRQVGDVVGASLRYRGISLAADYYLMRAPQDRNPPLIYGAYVATVGYRF